MIGSTIIVNAAGSATTDCFNVKVFNKRLRYVAVYSIDVADPDAYFILRWNNDKETWGYFTNSELVFPVTRNMFLIPARENFESTFLSGKIVNNAVAAVKCAIVLIGE